MASGIGLDLGPKRAEATDSTTLAITLRAPVRNVVALTIERPK